MDQVKENLDVMMNYTNSKDHKSVGEWNNRTIKEVYQTALHHTPYNKNQRIMMEELMQFTMWRIKWFPNKHGVSNTYSPITIVKGSHLTTRKTVCTNLALIYRPIVTRLQKMTTQKEKLMLFM